MRAVWTWTELNDDHTFAKNNSWGEALPGFIASYSKLFKCISGLGKQILKELHKLLNMQETYSWLKMKRMKITLWFTIHRNSCNVYYP